VQVKKIIVFTFFIVALTVLIDVFIVPLDKAL